MGNKYQAIGHGLWVMGKTQMPYFDLVCSFTYSLSPITYDLFLS